MDTPIKPSSTCHAPGRANRGASQRGAEAKQREPGHAGTAGPGNEPALQRHWLLRPDAAQQQHGVQVNMRIEQREGGRLGHRCAGRQRRTSRCSIQPLGLPRATQRLPSVDRQECGAREGECPCELRLLAQRLRHAHHARRDQHSVGHGADQHHAAHVLSAQPLAQHEGVLGADGDDESEAQREALNEYRQGERSCGCWGHDPGSLPVTKHEDKLNKLSHIK